MGKKRKWKVGDIVEYRLVGRVVEVPAVDWEETDLIGVQSLETTTRIAIREGNLRPAPKPRKLKGAR